MGQDCDRADRPAEGPQALYAEAARRTKSAREIGKAGKAKEREKWSASKQYGRETCSRIQTARHQAGWDPTPERPDDRVTSFMLKGTPLLGEGVSGYSGALVVTCTLLK